MSIPIRHHYIPQFILRNFTDEQDYLHCYRKSNRKVFRTKPTNIFVENNLYTQLDEKGQENFSAELEIAKSIEGPAKSVLNKIMHSGRKGVVPRLKKSEKRIWDEFLFCQLTRLPKSLNSIDGSEILSSVLEDFERDIRPLTVDERRIYSDPEQQRMLTQNAWSKVVSEPGGEFINVLEKKGLLICVIRNHKKSFIIGDSPDIRATHKGITDLTHPEVRILFPVSHDIVITQGNKKREEKIAPLSDTMLIRQINEVVYRQSEVIAGRSSELISSLAGVGESGGYESRT